MFSTSSTSGQTCVCGRVFGNAGSFTRHKKSCQKGKKRLASALRQAKESYHAKKRRVQGNDSLIDDLSHLELPTPDQVIDHGA